MKKIILIGGAPAIGKTTVAKTLSKRLKIPYLSTDMIRSEMRKNENQQNFPGLFIFDAKNIGSPADVFNKIPLKQLISAVDRESEDVWLGITRIINDKKDNECLIIEGVAVLPKQAASLENVNHNVKALILVNENYDLIKDTIYTRGLGGPPSMFSEEQKQMQIEWVKSSNERYKKEAITHGVKVIDLANSYFIEEIIESVF
ncbi:MAG: AAA family ATPase [Pyrinomonadaceae bacterium]